MKDLKTILESKPKVKDYDYQPYGYINALQNYIDKLEKAINYIPCCKSDSEQLIAFSDWVFEQPLHLGGNERKLVKQYLEGN